MFYADDTQIFVEFEESVDINEKLSEVFESIKIWMKNRKSYGNRYFRYCAPRLYNKLSSELRALESINTFKKHLKAEIFRMENDMETLTVRQEFAV